MNITERYIPNPYPLKEALERLFSLSSDWRRPLVGEGRGEAVTKTFVVEGCTYRVQFNPARITSSAAKVDPASIRERKCFLCPEHLPAEQKGVPFKEHYLILVNPYPIFPRHLTIPDIRHVDQRILPRIGDMLELAAALDDFIIFYNGPKCGASAPDHAHFQAGNKGFLPIEKEWPRRKDAIVIASEDKNEVIGRFHTIYNAMEIIPGDDEPMMNVLAWYEDGKWMVCIFPRKQHRPSCYSAAGDEQLLISPASVDMGGVFITPLEKDFNKITADDIKTILDEVSVRCRV